MLPRVSVVMAVCNSERFLEAAIESILDQSYEQFEFIIIDDFSTDNSATILDKYRDPRIVRVRNEKNLGLTRSLNIGLCLARGEYIARMDADDISLPSRFEDQVRFLDTHNNIAVVGTGVRLIDDQGNPIQDVHFPKDHDLIKWYLCFYNPIAHPSVMMRKEAVRQVGGYDSALTRSQDYDLWWRLGMQYELANLDHISIFLRQHTKQITHVYRSEQFLSGTKIPAKYVSNLLDVSISEKMIQALWLQDNLSSDQSFAIAKFILDYLEVCKREFKLKTNEQMAIKDAVSKILFFIIPHMAKIQFWPLFLKTIYTDPIKSLRVIKGHIRE